MRYDVKLDIKVYQNIKVIHWHYPRILNVRTLDIPYTLLIHNTLQSKRNINIEHTRSK